MTFVVDLGHLRLSSSNKHFHLSLSSSATLSSSTDTDGHAHIQADPLLSSACIYRGMNLRLILNITLDDETCTIASRIEIQRRLTTAIQETSLWPQLHLKPSLIITPLPFPRHLDHIAVILSHAPPDVYHSLSTLHKLGVGVPISDVKPPDGVPAFALEEVRLTMNISRVTPRMEIKFITTQTHDSVQGETRPRLESLDQSAHVCDANCPTKSSSDDMLDNHSMPSFCQHTALSSTEWASGSRLQQDSFHQIHVENFLALLDAGFRLSISRVPKNMMSGVIVVERSSFKRLEEFCPAVWSPEYLSAAASRSVFLPTISHALSHLSRDRVRSTSLKMKLEALAQQDLEPPRRYAVGRQELHPGLVQRTTSIRLWQLMQHRLRTFAPRQKLQPLFPATAERPCPRSGYLREAEQVNTHPTFSPTEVEFEETTDVPGGEDECSLLDSNDMDHIDDELLFHDMDWGQNGESQDGMHDSDVDWQ